MFRHPVALMFPYCLRCRATGFKKGEPCFCVQRRIEAERKACRNRWEALWYDSHLRPHMFPPNPVLRSQLCESR